MGQSKEQTEIISSQGQTRRDIFVFYILYYTNFGECILPIMKRCKLQSKITINIITQKVCNAFMPRCLAQNVFALVYSGILSFFFSSFWYCLYSVLYVPTKNKAPILLCKVIIFRFIYLKEHLFSYKKTRMLFYRLQLAIEAKKGGHKKRTSSSKKIINRKITTH